MCHDFDESDGALMADAEWQEGEALERELAAARKLLRDLYDGLSGNSDFVEKRMIEGFWEKFPVKEDS